MKKLQRTIVLLTENPTEFQAEGFAADAAIRHWDSVSFSHGVSTQLPADLEERNAAHLSEMKAEAGPNAVYLIVYNKE
jgi:hypothetical protein